jgi:hypothetical protein
MGFMIELDLNKHDLKPQDQLASHMNTKNALGSYKNPLGAARSPCLLDAGISIDLRVWLMLLLVSMMYCKDGDECWQGCWWLAKVFNRLHVSHDWLG